MRDIARRPGVATGAAYYYYPSKDAIVMDFYQRACAEMQPKIEAALEKAHGLEDRLRELIRVKLIHFAPNRGVLRALLRERRRPEASSFAVQPGDQGDSRHRHRLVPAAFWPIAAPGFRATWSRSFPACCGSSRWA